MENKPGYVPPPQNSLLGVLINLNKIESQKITEQDLHLKNAIIVWQDLIRECNQVGRGVILDPESIKAIESIFLKFIDNVKRDGGILPPSVKLITSLAIQIGRNTANVQNKTN